MNIHLEVLNHHFSKKPLLVGGKAMEYYHLRPAGMDIDLIAPEEDVFSIIRLYPTRVKYLWGDLGVCPFEFEIWRTIHLFDYEYLRKDAIELDHILVISLERLLFMKSLVIAQEKNRRDIEHISKEILRHRYVTYPETIAHIDRLLSQIEHVKYIEKTGPNEPKT